MINWKKTKTYDLKKRTEQVNFVNDIGSDGLANYEQRFMNFADKKKEE